jgi:uncharacterized protein (DUF2141 family)
MKLLIFSLLFGFSQSLSAFDLEVQIAKTVGKGTIGCALFNSENGFPMNNDKAEQLAQAGRLNSQNAVCRFPDLPTGTYAVSVFEDLNDNGKLDSSIVGFPKEPWGVSKDAPVQSFGPPKFQDAKFEVKTDLAIRINLNH